MTGLVGALIGACAIVFGIAAIVAPARVASRFSRRDDWTIVQDKERAFSPQATRVSGAVLCAAGVVLIVLAAVGVFG